jgi:hypothetical protein
MCWWCCTLPEYEESDTRAGGYEHAGNARIAAVGGERSHMIQFGEVHPSAAAENEAVETH